jgi:hypothetical protein
MARVNVFLDEDLLRKIDAEAAASRLKRSALIQDALTSYLDSRQREREESRRRSEMEAASKGMDELAEKLGSWDPDKVIREFRDSRSVRQPPKVYRTRDRKRRS